MKADHDAALTGTLHRLVTDLLTWLDDYPGDQVDPHAVATVRQSVDRVLERLPAGQRDRLAADDPDPASLHAVTGLVVDLMWWLDTCPDEEVDPDVAVKLQENTVTLPAGLDGADRRRARRRQAGRSRVGPPPEGV